MSKCCWKNGTDRLAQYRVATNLKFVKNAVSVNCNKVKYNKIRYAHINTNARKGKRFQFNNLSVHVKKLKTKEQTKVKQ